MERPGQHFLLSPKVRDLTITELSRIQERTAYRWFRQARWPETDGEAYCSHCGNLRCYEMTRSRFKCSAKECGTVFTVTSGTAFAWRKLPFKKMLFAIWFVANSVKGKAALQLSRELGVQYKTAWVLLMKLRGTVASRREEMVLDGEVEIDGKYAGGHVRPKNKAEDRVDRRLKENRSPDRLCILAIRQRGMSGRTITRVIREEDGDAAWAAVRDHVSRNAKVFADEHGSYNDVVGLNRMERVNHSQGSKDRALGAARTKRFPDDELSRGREGIRPGSLPTSPMGGASWGERGGGGNGEARPRGR
jgi:hypothetical protein